MLLLLYMFKNLKKNEHIMHFLCLLIFADILPIFSPILPIRYFLDLRRYFPNTDIINTSTRCTKTELFAQNELVKMPILKNGQHSLFPDVIVGAIKALTTFQHQIG